MSVFDKLNNWKNKKKSRWVRIEHDDGYGACCWTVTLGDGKNKSLFEEIELVEDKGVGDFPGLEELLNYALDNHEG